MKTGEEEESLSVAFLGEGADIDSGTEVAVEADGGSMIDVGGAAVIASGSKGISSLADDVSMVIWLVGLAVERRV